MRAVMRRQFCAALGCGGGVDPVRRAAAGCCTRDPDSQPGGPPLPKRPSTGLPRLHDDYVGGEKVVPLHGAVSAEHVADLDVGEGDVGGLAARSLVEGGVLIDGDGLRDFVGALDGEGEVLDGGDAAGGPGFAEGGAHLLHLRGLLGSGDHDEHGADGFGLVVEIAAWR